VPTELLGPVISWATEAGPPNWLFLLAVLTRPAVWSKSVVEAARRRLSKPSKESGA
jgi:hypothetical protein